MSTGSSSPLHSPGLLVGKEFGIHHQAVLQVVNAQRGRFAKSDRAQMPRNFRAALVSRRNGSSQFIVSDEHVGFEVIDALI